MQENPQTEEQKIPSKEEIIAMMQDQIDVKQVQLNLQEINTKLAVQRAEELRALAFISQMTNPRSQDGTAPYEGGVPYTITQEDMDKNPELAEQGIAVGDEVMINMDEEETVDKPKSKRGLKK
jgi:hypothetical protein